MVERKNNIYRKLLNRLFPAGIPSGVLELLEKLRNRGIKTAVGSSSKDAGSILRTIGLQNAFDAVVDGTHIKRSKLDPEVFALAAERLVIAPESPWMGDRFREDLFKRNLNDFDRLFQTLDAANQRFRLKI